MHVFRKGTFIFDHISCIINPHVREKQIRIFGYLQERIAAWGRKSHEVSFLLNKKEVFSLENKVIRKINKAKHMKFMSRCKI